MNKRKLYHSFFIIGYWIVAVNFLTTFSVLMIKSFMDLEAIDSENLRNKIAIYWISPIQYIEGILAGTLLGIAFLIIDNLSDKYHWERLSFGKLIMVKSLAYGIGLVIIILSIANFLNYLGFYPLDIFSPFLITKETAIILVMILFFIATQIIILNFIIQTNRKIGDFNVISFLTGRYREPMLEKRLFMFLDLKASTSLAEKLSELQYSQLIRDCFIDFNYCVKKYPKIDIYQYVGDEVVTTSKWTDTQCMHDMVNLFFDFTERLEKRTNHYIKYFGILPCFKAGIHGGEVSVAEIGTIRRDIAFHGDVINTASRIQHLCNELNERLLISSSIAACSMGEMKHKLQPLGAYQLKGKENEIEVFAVQGLKEV